MIRKLARKIKYLIIKEDNSPLRKGESGTFIFIHINKTGGTSIAKVIGLPKNNHFSVEEVMSKIGEEEFNKAYVFCVVRNPWDKVVSHYKFRVKTNQTNMGDNHISFKEWVKQTYGANKNPFYYDKPRMFAPQSDWIKDNNGIIRVSNIIRFESLSNNFESIAKSIGVKKKLPHLNATKKDSYTEYYDKETIEIVRNWFKEDIERFNYSFDKTSSSNV